MKRTVLATLLISITFLVLLSSTPRILPVSHAQGTGEVCIAATGVATCPETPPILTPTSPSILLVAILVNTSISINGFDITILADHTILKPVDVFLTGSILPGAGAATINVECFGGVAKIGTCLATDTADTLHFGATTGNTVGTATGLLFTANYTITGTTPNTPISFQMGCGTATSNPPICVALTTGKPQPAPATIQTAGFSNQPYFALDATPASLSIDLGSSDSSTIILTSLNTYAGNVTLTTSVSPSGPGAVLSPTSQVLTAGSQALASLTVDVGPTVVPGGYDVKVIGTPNSTLPVNTVTLHVTVPAPDFLITIPSALKLNATISKNSTITFTATHAFSGTVALSISSSGALKASLNRTSISLTTNGSANATLTVSAPVGGDYKASITGVSGQLSHSLAIDISVIDFDVTARESSLTIARGTSDSATFTVTNKPPDAPCCYRGNVTLQTSLSPPKGLGVSCGPSLATFTSTIEANIDYRCTLTASTVGSYTIIVAGLGFNGNSFHAAVLTVNVQGPDFRLAASPITQTVQPGSSANVTVVITRQATFNGTLILSATSSPVGPVLGFNVTTVTLNTATRVTGASLTIGTSSDLAPGNYTIAIVVANSTSLPIRSHQVTVNILVSALFTAHDVAIFAVTTNQTSTTVGNNVTFTVIVQDLGINPENVTVVALVGDTTVAQQTATLQAGGNTTLTLIWQTSGFIPGAYVVGAKVLSVTGEKNTANNILRSTQTVTLNAKSQGLFSTSNLSQMILPIGIIVVLVGLAVLAVFVRSRRVSNRQAT